MSAPQLASSAEIGRLPGPVPVPPWAFVPGDLPGQTTAS
jgi:hypothetical protein